MEPLLNQLKNLPERWSASGKGARQLGVLLVVAAAVAGGIAFLTNGGGDQYQYAFTNLSPEDSQAAAGVLKSANIPFRLEASGSALAVPSTKVYDARLILAAQGLPRAGGVGFELFDKGQFGVSEFTQRVNLRRAIEGELGRTVGSLAEVRSARVHLTLGERGLYRDEDRKAAASVVLNLQPGRNLSPAQLQGIRNLVSAAVPGLSPTAVTVVDGHGAVLGDEPNNASARGFEQKLETELQQRLVSLLEPVVGAGGVIARVAVSADYSEVSQNAEVFDPDAVATRSERKSSTNQSNENQAGGGVAGAQANQPLVAPGAGTTAPTTRGNQASSDEVKNYEISKTNTTTIIKQPRVRRLSLAVLVNQTAGSPRSEAELNRLGELCKRAVGFDEARGDQFQLSAETLTKPEGGENVPEMAGPARAPWWLPWAAGGAGLLVLLIVAIVALRGGKAPAPAPLALKPGMKVAELEAQATAAGAKVPALADPTKAAAGLPAGAEALPADPGSELDLKNKAVDHAKKDPVKTAQLIRAWIAADQDQKEARRA